MLTIDQVLGLAERMPARYRSLVLLAAFGSLRWGEVAALRRQDIDAAAGTVRVRQALIEQRGAGLVLGPPKSRAGHRVVSIPAAILPALRDHLATSVEDDPAAFMFTGPSRRPQVDMSRGRANLRDLMARIRHDSAHAAMVYQHATTTADREIADAVSAQVDMSRGLTRGQTTTEAGAGESDAGAGRGPVTGSGSSDEGAESSGDGS